MVRDGLYYGISLLVVAVIVFVGTHWISLTAIPFLLAVFFLIFFRDPNRDIPTEPGLIVSPGDGKVEEAEWIETTAGARFRVSIFLSVFDVHVNRVPISGRVTVMEYREDWRRGSARTAHGHDQIRIARGCIDARRRRTSGQARRPRPGRQIHPRRVAGIR
jgi:phosphatidylserine decarboxylase precursor-related protein